ncbi:TAP-like protein [Nonomuraea solani]|uniref:TAP-like protein n=1 Tax=Nonomuraea solani TaxID=1144553 RepID=A0A1H6BKI1_9ACTN|nr:alpha/beta fold hydrolase [Nonomuraea solani]SEG61200.1 TAP-like protein [Nonomuraea solani]
MSALTFGTLAAPEPPAITWSECPVYSDAVLRSLGVDDQDLPQARRLFDRLECGTVAVPQDYADPDGKQITVALTRLKAKGRRLGSVAVNPGGPGGSGRLMPVELAMSGLDLNDHYDLIGFDPRGVGASTKAACQVDRQESPPPGPITRARARKIYDQTVKNNRTCDSAFIGRLTTANVARDLDRVRAALGERKIGFLGVSWGTWLGAVYRSMFPGSVHRMWLDSVALPVPRMDVFAGVRAKATDRGFQRMAAWIAERHGTYGFGTSKAGVVSALTRLREKYDAHPITFTDVDVTIDGRMIAEAAAQPSMAWPDVAQVLKELVDATGPEAPPALKRVMGGERPPIPPDAPERQNITAHVALFCNEDLGPRTFESAWNAYTRRLKSYPVTGRASQFFPPCAGWPHPVQAPRLRHGGGSLVLSGHLRENLSPYEWTLETREATGGHVVTIDDDVHGSAPRTPGCQAKIVTYFESGRLPETCPAAPAPANEQTRR